MSHYYTPDPDLPQRSYCLTESSILLKLLTPEEWAEEKTIVLLTYNYRDPKSGVPVDNLNVEGPTSCTASIARTPLTLMNYIDLCAVSHPLLGD